MPWVRFDDDYPEHRKVRRLSPPAFRLHTEAIIWCAKQLTDGFVPADDLGDVSTVRQPRRYVPQLVTRGLWHEAEGGWVIHDFLDYQPSKAQVEQDRKARAERQRRWRESRRNGISNASTNTSRDGVSNGVSNAAPPHTRPGPVRGRAGPGAYTSPPGPRAVPDWCGLCNEDTRHVDVDDTHVARCPTCHPLREDAS